MATKLHLSVSGLGVSHSSPQFHHNLKRSLPWPRRLEPFKDPPASLKARLVRFAVMVKRLHTIPFLCRIMFRTPRIHLCNLLRKIQRCWKHGYTSCSAEPSLCCTPCNVPRTYG